MPSRMAAALTAWTSAARNVSAVRGLATPSYPRARLRETLATRLVQVSPAATATATRISQVGAMVVSPLGGSSDCQTSKSIYTSAASVPELRDVIASYLTSAPFVSNFFSVCESVSVFFCYRKITLCIVAVPDEQSSWLFQ